jgi:hypothetical protein
VHDKFELNNLMLSCRKTRVKKFNKQDMCVPHVDVAYRPNKESPPVFVC